MITEQTTIDHMLATLVPDHARRARCLSLFADTICYLNAHSNDLWGVYLAPHHLQLVAGNLIVLTVESNALWVPLDERALLSKTSPTNSFDQLESWQWDEDVFPAYKAVPSRNGYYRPSHHARDWATIRPYHYSFLDRVSSKYAWLNVKSQRLHQPAVVQYLRSELKRQLPDPVYSASPSGKRNPISLRLPEELPIPTALPEGKRLQITVNAYERNSAARHACIAHHGTICSICRSDFGSFYGSIAANIVHVHHLTPIASVKEEYQIDPIADLCPVCPNCHAVIHSRNPPYAVEEVRQLISEARGNSHDSPTTIKLDG